MKMLLMALIALSILGVASPIHADVTPEVTVAVVQDVPTYTPSEDEQLKRGQFSISRARDSRSYKITVESTAYSPTLEGQTSGTGLAYDGREARPYYTIAVDPRIIPLGSIVYIPGYGWGLAHDTGNAIKGYVVDVCLPDGNVDALYEWGRRTVTATVIPPTESYKLAW